jgi:hypothetical protein
MADYWKRGFKDPQLPKLYLSLLQRMYVLSVNISRNYGIGHSSFLSSIYLRQHMTARDWAPQIIREELETFVSDTAMLELEPPHTRENKKRELYSRHEHEMKVLFDHIFTSDIWTDGIAMVMEEILLSPTVDSNDQQLIVSAVMLSALEYFDMAKFRTLIHVYEKASDEALTPIHNSLYSYQELFSGIDENCIPKEYQGVKHQVSILHKAYNMPYEAMGNFVSNGNGVDLLSNRNNPKKLSDINRATNQELCLYNSSEAFRNIPISYPSSKGCPSKGKDDSGKIIFEFENENLALLNFATDIEQKNETIELIFSLHSNNKLIKSKHYIEYQEAKANPCGIFVDPENILNTYLKFIDNFTTTFETLAQKSVTITTKKDH